eukprot:GFKZ01008142.1.p1 GENE.GFKZ01008142.1~~GFKZ01008142.1.p1  ORF type:complete len:152 (-),score=23.64 GFKZ01008142.1:469-924(-)
MQVFIPPTANPLQLPLRSTPSAKHLSPLLKRPRTPACPQRYYLLQCPVNRALRFRRVSPRAQTGYIPDDDDRADTTSDVPTQLTLAQQLLLKQYEDQVERMSTEECRNLAIEIARQMMVKDNILKQITKKEVNFGIEPPDPDDFQDPDKRM